VNKTKIDWCDYTWNPITGCLGPGNDGVRCRGCYAEREANGRLRNVYLSQSLVLVGDPADPFAPRFWPERMVEPQRVKKPCTIFAGSMAEIWSPQVPDPIKAAIIEVARRCPWHTFQFLTHQPAELARWSPLPDNVWVGVTATRHLEAVTAAKCLYHVDAPVRFLSLEPLRGPVALRLLPPSAIDWIIVGAQTGPGAQPVEPGWVESILYWADRVGLPVLLKRNLGWHEQRQQWPDASRTIRKTK